MSRPTHRWAAGPDGSVLVPLPQTCLACGKPLTERDFDYHHTDPTICISYLRDERAALTVERDRARYELARLRKPRPWTPERREKDGRAARDAHEAWAAQAQQGWTPRPWAGLTEEQREGYRMQGEAAVRADEEGR